MEELFTGEIGTLISSYDWSQTSLGKVDNWSSDLKAAVQILATELDRAKTSPISQNPTVCENNNHYQILFESIDQGFCICEMIFDHLGQPIDYRFLEINNKYEAMTGLKQVVGRTARDIMPTLEDFWFETYGSVVLTGKSVRFENKVAAMNKWFDINAFPVGTAPKHQFGILFSDISDRKRQELNGNFLAEIQKDLIQLEDANQIMSVVGEKIRQWFGFSLLTFSDIDIAAGTASNFYNNRDADILDTIATHHLSDYLGEIHLEKLNAGQVVTIEDVTTDPDIKGGGAAYSTYQILSVISTPYLSGGELKFLLGGCRRQPSEWREDEQKLISELAEKIYLRIARARTEEALQISNKRFEKAMQAIDGILFEYNSQTDTVYRSEGLFQLIGVRAEDATPRKHWWTERIHSDDQKDLKPVIANAEANGDRYQDEYRIRHADGRWIDVWERGYLQRDAQGEIIGIAGFISDISDRKYAERRLRESEKLYRAIGETIDYGIWICDPNGQNTYTSPSFLELLGITQAECSGLDWGTALHPDDRDRTIQAWLECVRTKDVWDIEHSYLGVDGNWHPILARGVPVKNHEGETICWAGINLDISRLKQTELALRQSEERLRLAMEAAQMGTWDVDLISGEAIWSEQHFTILGYKPSETGQATSEMWSCLIHPEDRERVQQEWQESRQEQRLYRAEYRVLRADNNQVAWISGVGCFNYDASGQAIRSIGVVFDISDRKHTEEALYFSRERLNLVMESVDLGTWYCDLPFDHLKWNDTCKLHFGLTPETDVTIDMFFDRLHPDDRDRVQQEIVDSIENHLKYDIDYRTVAPNGEVHWIRAIGRGFYDITGKPTRFDGVTVDMTASKEAEQALIQSEARYRHLTESIPQLVWIASPEGFLFEVNQRWLDFTGLTLAQAQTNGWEFIVHPDDLPTLSENWATAQQEGNYQAEGRMRQVDGLYRWHLHKAVPIRNEQGQIIRWFGTATDIEAQKQLEEKLTLLIKQVQERNQELDNFSHIVSHDLKAPLRAIANLAQWLEEDLEGKISSDNQIQLQLMRSRVYRMEALINGLLTYARIAKEDIPLELVSVQELLAEIIDSLDPLPPFSVEIAHPLPTFLTKRILLSQVLTNLIGNAIKHHDRADGKVKIAVQDHPEHSEFYEFAISDDGRGIDLNQQTRIFDIFQTVESQDKSQSTGIGLAIVKKIVNAEGGKVYLESEVGRGSTFRFTWHKSKFS